VSSFGRGFVSNFAVRASDFEFTKMRFGLNFFPSFRLDDMSTADYFSLGLMLSERADELGYSSVKTVEHYFHDYDGHSPNQSFSCLLLRHGLDGSG
jgi:hypothetical protein